MFKKTKAGLLFAALLFISGCTDSLVLQFNKDVDLVEQAETEIVNALKGIAVVDAFSWHKKVQGIKSPTKLTIKFTADEANDNYSIAQVTKIINEKLTYQGHDVSVKITITEEREELLELLEYEKGHEIIAQLDWNKAHTDVFYYESESKSYGRVYADRAFICAIDVPLKNTIPSLTFTYKVEGEQSAFLSTLLGKMSFDIKHDKEFVGLPVDKQLFNIKFENSYSDPELYSSAVLVFEEIGETKNQTRSPFGVTSAPKGMNKEGCEALLKEKSGSTLLGLLGGVSAVNNVVSVALR